MVYVIETNLSMNGDKIADHQSRVIEKDRLAIQLALADG